MHFEWKNLTDKMNNYGKDFLELRKAKVKIRMKHNYNKDDCSWNIYCLKFPETLFQLLLCCNRLISNKLFLCLTDTLLSPLKSDKKDILYQVMKNVFTKEIFSKYFWFFLSSNRREKKKKAYDNKTNFCMLIFSLVLLIRCK